MPSQDEIMHKICDLVTKGAGAELSDDDKTELHNRYYDWIAKKKDGVPTSPQEIWETGDGEKIQKQFEKIGLVTSINRTSARETRHDAVIFAQGFVGFFFGGPFGILGFAFWFN